MSIQVALAGNPNSGKTTLFNALTGANQFVGNWPGVTVEKKEGKYKGDKEIKITDLPGIYSLSPYTLEEVVSREYLLNEKVDVILNIVDGSNLERNLYLTTQLLELGIPVVVAINMLDVIEKRGDKVNYVQLSKELGCPVMPISALKNKGIDEVMAKVKESAHRSFEAKNIYDKELNSVLDQLSHLLPRSIDQHITLFYSIKLFERDDKIISSLNTKVEDESLIQAIEKKMDDDSESIITDARYSYITKIIKDCYVKANREGLTTSDKIDRFVTNRILALPIFALVMFIVYYVSVTSVGTFVTDWTNDVLFGEMIPPAIEGFLVSINCILSHEAIHSIEATIRNSDLVFPNISFSFRGQPYRFAILYCQRSTFSNLRLFPLFGARFAFHCILDAPVYFCAVFGKPVTGLFLLFSAVCSARNIY